MTPSSLAIRPPRFISSLDDDKTDPSIIHFAPPYGSSIMMFTYYGQNVLTI